MKRGFWDSKGASPYAFLVAIIGHPPALIALIVGGFCLYMAIHLHR